MWVHYVILRPSVINGSHAHVFVREWCARLRMFVVRVDLTTTRSRKLFPEGRVRPRIPPRPIFIRKLYIYVIIMSCEYIQGASNSGTNVSVRLSRGRKESKTSSHLFKVGFKKKEKNWYSNDFKMTLPLQVSSRIRSIRRVLLCSHIMFNVFFVLLL